MKNTSHADKAEEYLPMTQAPGRIIVKLHPDQFVTSSQVLMQRASFII
ncbi:hypothetical protein [Thermosporothrix hazakensis]|nr:hypothetical protein [Thermosporothrix hazakensis]